LISLALESVISQMARYARLLMRIEVHPFTLIFCHQSLATLDQEPSE
jgi:hypothetical protein